MRCCREEIIRQSCQIPVRCNGGLEYLKRVGPGKVVEIATQDDSSIWICRHQRCEEVRDHGGLLVALHLRVEDWGRLVHAREVVVANLADEVITAHKYLLS
eukprot:SM000096S24890  [mRNA]  locus=s96:380245:380947:- [translate_table: standard]